MAAKTFSVEVRGLKEVRDALKVVAERARQATIAGNYALAETIMNESQPLVPIGVDYPGHQAETLKNSAFITLPNERGEIEFGYGGPASAYATVQHESMDYRHPRGGQAKYLEIPFNAYRGRRGIQVIVDTAKRVFRDLKGKFARVSISRGNFPLSPWG